MLNAASRRRVACSLALLAWVLVPKAASAHGHEHHHEHYHSRGHRTAGAASRPRGGAQHSSRRTQPGSATSHEQAANAGAGAARTVATSFGDAAWRRQRSRRATEEQRSVASAAADPALAAVRSNPRGAASALPMHIKLAAAAKADVAVKELRARKAGVYPGSPARRALAEDPNLAVRFGCVTCHRVEPCLHSCRDNANSTVCPNTSLVCNTRCAAHRRDGRGCLSAEAISVGPPTQSANILSGRPSDRPVGSGLEILAVWLHGAQDVRDAGAEPHGAAGRIPQAVRPCGCAGRGGQQQAGERQHDDQHRRPLPRHQQGCGLASWSVEAMA